MSKVIYEPKAEKWHGVYYPGLPCFPLTKDRLVHLAKVHGYNIKFVLSLYMRRGTNEHVENSSNTSNQSGTESEVVDTKEEMKDASNPSAQDSTW